MKLRKIFPILVIVQLFTLEACTSQTTPITTPESLRTMITPTNLNIIVSPPDAGIVSPASGDYERGTTLTLTATPVNDFTFAYWGGDTFSYWDNYFYDYWENPFGENGRPIYIDSLPTAKIIMNRNKTIIVQFSKTSLSISEVRVGHITESTAEIEWTATDEGYSQIEYGLSTNYGYVSDIYEGAKDHTNKLTKLETKTLYHFRILFVNEDGAKVWSNDYVFTTRKVQDLVSAELYPVRTTGDKHLTHFGSTLFNDSSQTITVYKMEILDESSNVAYAITETGRNGGGDCPSISETWGNGKVSPQDSLSMCGWVWEPPLVGREDISAWQVEWYCESADGTKFTINGYFSSYMDFYNWFVESNE